MGAYLNSIRRAHHLHGSLYLDILTINKYDFTVDKSRKMIIGEIAQINHGRTDPLDFTKRVWMDACDNGMIVKSRDTGKAVLFTEGTPVMNGDEIGAWVFHPYKEPTLEGWTLHIIND